MLYAKLTSPRENKTETSVCRTTHHSHVLDLNQTYLNSALILGEGWRASGAEMLSSEKVSGRLKSSG